MTTSPNRRPSGTPAGGQFAPSNHPESEVSLDGEADVPPVLLRVRRRGVRR